MRDCLFCKIVVGDIPSYKVYEDAHTFAFLDIFPAIKGHLLVIPKEHCADIFEASEEIVAQVAKTAKKMADVLANKLNPDGVTIMQANREAAWQTVFHLHMHVIPRWSGDSLSQPWISKPNSDEYLDETFSTLIS